MARISRDNIQYFLDYGIDLSTRTIYLGYGDPHEDHDLDQVLTSNVIKGLHILHHANKETPIDIIINNQGGSTQHGLAIYDKIRGLSNPVNITVLGHCYSMAAWVLQAGHRRLMTRHSSLMIHDGEGTKNKFYKEVDTVCRDILLARIRERHPDFSVSKLQRMLDTDTYLWPQQALELGLIDEVIE